MSIIQQKIYLGKNSTGATLTFGLSADINVSGYQQEIDRLTEETKQKLINPIEDYEITRFRYGSTARLWFYFLNSNNTNHYNNYSSAGFNGSEINNKDDVFRNSFYILDFYDTYSSNTQTRLFTNYQTQLGSAPQFQFDSNQGYQISYCNIPNWFINAQNYSFIRAYVKFSFYNAKDGNLQLFYNNAINDASDPENLYFEVYLYPQSRTWRFASTPINAYEVNPENAYVERNNETFQNFENKKQCYPDGNVFEDDGTYDVVE